MDVIERLRQFAKAAEFGNFIFQPEDAVWLTKAADEIESHRINEREMIREKREDARWAVAGFRP